MNPNTEEFWNNHISKTTKLSTRDHITADRIEIISSMIGNECSKLLDVGCGYGFLEHKLNKTRKKLKVYGLDISFVGIERLIAIYGKKFIVGSAESIPFREKSFDYLCLTEVLEHLYTDEAEIAFREAYRVIKKNGFIVVSVPLYDKAFSGHPSGHVRMYTPELLYSELEKFNFDIVEKYFLFAFKSFYKIKSFIARFFGVKYPNNLIILARKK